MRPSLALSVEAETLDGELFRLDGDTPDPANRPLAINFRTQRGDGFADASVNLRRSVLRDWPDLNLLDTWRFIGADGSVAYEGRVAGLGRETGDGQQVNVQLQGWMSHAKDRRFREIYVDRDLNRWTTPPSNARKLAHVAAAAPKNYLSGTAAVEPDADGYPAVLMQHTRLADAVATRRSTAETWYDGQGVPLGGIGGAYYDLDKGFNAALANTIWYALAALSSDDVSTTADTTGNLAGTSAAFSVGASGDRRYAMLQFLYYATATNDGEWSAWFRNLYVTGTHGLALSGDGGLTVSALIRDIASRFAPRLDTANVQDTTYAQRHVAYLDPVYPYDAWAELNRAHLWELSVWEDRKLHYEPPASLDDYDWQVRTDDPGVTLSFGGDALSDLANGVEVAFTDLLTLKQRLITPEDYADLGDTDPDNPANLAGLQKWAPYDVPFPCLEADAVQYGRAYLAEVIRAKSPVTINAGFHVRDRAGNLRPAWKVRAGQRIAITDHPNDSPRRIIDTSYAHDARGLTISADRASAALSAFVDRVSLARTAAGLA